MFLDQVVGPAAVSAVSAIFPVVAVSIALSTMVGSGMPSLLARHLGAGQSGAARALFCSAHGLALILAMALIAVFAMAGGRLTLALSGGDTEVAGMAWRYLSVIIGAVFLDDPRVAAELARILRPMMWLYTPSGPILILALYFQAGGDAARASLLTLSKPYLLQPPLIIALAVSFSEPWLWYAMPLADALLIFLASIVWRQAWTPGIAGFGCRPEQQAGWRA